MPVPWNEDDPRAAPTIVRNLASLLREIDREALARRRPTIASAQDWHRAIYAGVALPVSYYAGEIRDSDHRFPELYGYEVRVGPHRGVDSSLVPQQLAFFEASIQRAAEVLDAAIARREKPADPGQLGSVLTLCAFAHGEWIRIHPFANGNGRTARIWANWCALRYSLPPFVRLKPRPASSLYASAASASMRGNHLPMARVFADMLDRLLG